jgi:glutamine amidotransferase
VIAILDYKGGNLTSVQMALAEVGVQAEITADPAAVAKADKLVFPGVGAAGAAMEHLRRLELEASVREFVASGKPFLGICIGCQVLLDSSEENGGTACLGLLQGTVRHFPPDAGIKIPHMGWNQVSFTRAHPLTAGIPEDSEFYFVHSYYPAPAEESQVLGKTEYGGIVFPSMLAKGNVAACQFHVEKSGACGLRLLKNFSDWDGK